VRDVSLSVREGEVYGFLGPNGAGKSTTIRMLLGLIAPTGGEVRLFGHPLATEPNVLRRVGSLVDGGNFYPFLSGRKNLEVLARTHGMDAGSRAGRIDALIEQVGLAGDGHRKVKGYSTGMRQRLGIQEMRFLIRRLAEQDGKAVFLSSHLLHEVQQLCDRVAIITKGAVVHESTIADLLRHDGGFRVEAEPVPVAAAALSARWACRVNGQQLHVDATRDEVPEVVKRLVGAGANIFAIVPAERNLEEVFLSMTQDEEQQEAANA
jgi:ABC-2 type transport system ATP-binding protein